MPSSFALGLVRRAVVECRLQLLGPRRQFFPPFPVDKGRASTGAATRPLHDLSVGCDAGPLEDALQPSVLELVDPVPAAAAKGADRIGDAPAEAVVLDLLHRAVPLGLSCWASAAPPATAPSPTARSPPSASAAGCWSPPHGCTSCSAGRLPPPPTATSSPGARLPPSLRGSPATGTVARSDQFWEGGEPQRRSSPGGCPELWQFACHLASTEVAVVPSDCDLAPGGRPVRSALPLPRQRPRRAALHPTATRRNDRPPRAKPGVPTGAGGQCHSAPTPAESAYPDGGLTTDLRANVRTRRAGGVRVRRDGRCA
jgi:hypothetical protein